jgi:hypothetical protein
MFFYKLQVFCAEVTNNDDRQAKMNQASRLLENDFDLISTDDVMTITAEDIVIPKPIKCEKRRIVF